MNNGSSPKKIDNIGSSQGDGKYFWLTVKMNQFVDIYEVQSPIMLI